MVSLLQSTGFNNKLVITIILILFDLDKKLDIENSKSSSYSQNKYFSAPVSTKENGLVTKFKFNDKQNKDIKKVEEDKSQKLMIKSNTTENNHERASEQVSDQDTSIFKKNFKSEGSEDGKKVL